MKILSWNVYYHNPSLHNVIELVCNSDADVICLQEVTEQMLTRLKRISAFHITSAIDFIEDGVVHYLVILSKYTLTGHDTIILPRYPMSRVQRRGKSVQGLEVHYVDFTVNGMQMRVFNCHLSFGLSVFKRKSQLEHLMNHFDSKRVNVVCGDFNTFGKWYFHVVRGWEFNMTLPETFVNEEREFEKLIAHKHMYDPFIRMVTRQLFGTDLFGFKLDCILLPRGIKFLHKQVMRNTFGSDHRPLWVEI